MLVALLLILFAGTAFLWRQTVRRGRQYAPLSVARTDPAGAALALDLLRQYGLQADPWESDWRDLSTPGLLFVLEPPEAEKGGGEVLPPEAAALDRWVSDGSVVVLAGAGPGSLAETLGLKIKEDAIRKFAPARSLQPGGLSAQVESLELGRTAAFVTADPKRSPATPDEAAVQIPSEHWVPLFAAGPQGAPQVMAASRGRGLYVAAIDPSFASNGRIANADHAQFLLNLARLAPAGGRVWFDEYHKRAPVSGLAVYLRERSLAPAAIYLLLWIGLLAWRSGARLGEPRDADSETARDTREYVDGLAALYRSAGLSREALRLLLDDFKRRVGGQRRQVPLDDVVERWTRRTGAPAARAETVLRRAEAAVTSGGEDTAGMVAIAAELSKLEEPLQRKRRDVPGKQ